MDDRRDLLCGRTISGVAGRLGAARRVLLLAAGVAAILVPAPALGAPDDPTTSTSVPEAQPPTLVFTLQPDGEPSAEPLPIDIDPADTTGSRTLFVREADGRAVSGLELFVPTASGAPASRLPAVTAPPLIGRLPPPCSNVPRSIGNTTCAIHLVSGQISPAPVAIHWQAPPRRGKRPSGKGL